MSTYTITTITTTMDEDKKEVTDQERTKKKSPLPLFIKSFLEMCVPQKDVAMSQLALSL